MKSYKCAYCGVEMVVDPSRESDTEAPLREEIEALKTRIKELESKIKGNYIAVSDI